MSQPMWTVPGYIEIRELGRGASGLVVLAEHEATQVKVAIKYLAEQLRDDETFIRAFRAEARVMAEVESPQVARLYEYIEAPGGAAIVMELVDGVALRAILREQGPTEPEAALVVLKGSLLGLAAAHDRGVVHRDYKPENVLVNGEGQSKLADFGISARSGRQGPLAGTPSYMAPEQWAGAPASPSTDIYAATATFFECLAGQPPFRAPGDIQGLRRQHEQAPVPVELVPEAVRGLVRRGLAKDAKQRPKDAATFLRELEAVAGAGYGAEWEEEGRSKLARRALLLALLFPLAAVQANATAIGTTILGMSRKAFTLAASITALVLILGGAGAAALWPTSTSPTPLPSVSAAADVSPSPSPSESPSPSPSPSESPSESPSPSPSPSDEPEPSPSKKPSPKPSPSPSPSPSPTPTIGVFVLNIDRGNVCILKACTESIIANTTFRPTGSGNARVYIEFIQSGDGKNPAASAAAPTYKDFTVPSSDPYTYGKSMALGQACGNYSYSIVKAWIVVGGKTVMSDTKSIYCGPIIR